MQIKIANEPKNVKNEDVREINVHNITPFALKNKKPVKMKELQIGNYSKEA